MNFKLILLITFLNITGILFADVVRIVNTSNVHGETDPCG